jgi:hypothetical protein
MSEGNIDEPSGSGWDAGQIVSANSWMRELLAPGSTSSRRLRRQLNEQEREIQSGGEA